jgi:GNAT superfamily N-acetyltransferase
MTKLSLTDDCILVRLTECPPLPTGFSCSKEPAIDTFFHEDYADYEAQLLGNSYGYYLVEDPSKLVAAFTVANSALVLDFLQSARKNKINKAIPRIKQRRQYPALLLCQVVVFDEFLSCKIGDELLAMIKEFAYNLNRSTACRYLIVEAVNKSKVVKFYERNGFALLYSSEQEEIKKTNRKLTPEGNLTTRLMMYDLLFAQTN